MLTVGPTKVALPMMANFTDRAQRVMGCFYTKVRKVAQRFAKHQLAMGLGKISFSQFSDQ